MILFMLISVFCHAVQVLVLRNFGIIVGGETVEETFFLVRQLMTGVETMVGSFFYEFSVSKSFYEWLLLNLNSDYLVVSQLYFDTYWI